MTCLNFATIEVLYRFMAKGDDMRLQVVTETEFREMLLAKLIRPASLEDVNGTHHKRNLYLHPRTQQYFVAVK